MQLTLFVIADYANITENGKLNVMGIFSEIYASRFPARHSSMQLVIKFRGELGEYGDQRNLVIQLHAPDGQIITTVSGMVEIPPPHDGRKSEVNAIVALNNVVFPAPGPYQFVVKIDRDYKGESTVYVSQLDVPDSAGG